jgi:S-adenosylmethionine-diacylglycerol 3-amino-3-carboxypropyl transferase
MVETEIAARAAFDKIRYAQVWEDADVLVEALAPKPTDTILSIASAGDNAFALIAAGAAKVVAMDLSPAQLACVRLRSAAYATLTHQGFLELLGARPSDRRAALLAQAAVKLSAADQRFWAAQKSAVTRLGAAGLGKFESYFRIFRTYVLPFVHDEATVRALLEPRTKEDREVFFETRWNTPGWKRLLGMFFSKTVMGRLGRDPEFFRHASGSLAEQVGANTRHALVNLDPSANPYLHWILTGTFGQALPRALREEHFDTIHARLDRLELRLGPIEAFGEEGGVAHGFNLSDIFEYMSPEGHAKAYAAILKAAAPGARIAYWNMMVPRQAPEAFAAKVTRDDALSERLHAQDNAFFYRAFHLERVA